VTRRGGGRLLLFAVALFAAVGSGRAVSTLVDADGLGQVRDALARLAIALLISAALAYLLRWKLTGEAPVALVGSALLVYGVGVALFLPMSGLLVGQAASPVLSSGVIRGLVSLIAMYLLVRSLSTPVVDSRLRPLRTFAVALAGVALAIAVLSLGLRVGDATAPPIAVDRVLTGATAAGWALVAYLLVRRAAHRLQGDVLWIGLAAGCLSLANVIRVVSAGTSAAGMTTAAAVTTLAAGVALYGTSLHLTQVLTVQGSERMRLYVDLVGHEARARTAQARDEERLHDARSTLAAIRCAAGTLQRYESKLQGAQRESLQTAVTSELVRLEKLIDPPPPDQCQSFDVEQALAAVVETERAVGLDITLQLRNATAYGRPLDVARIVHNLLGNARRHAGGTPVRLSATTREGVVAISVADEGPGVPTSMREAIFERGRHAKAEGSSGLGLYVARELALGLGGDLAVHDRVGGGAVFMLRLPARPPEDVEDVEDVGEAVEGKRRRGAARRQKQGWLPGPVADVEVTAG